jgi:hypothetical protein
VEIETMLAMTQGLPPPAAERSADQPPLAWAEASDISAP